MYSKFNKGVPALISSGAILITLVFSIFVPFVAIIPLIQFTFYRKHVKKFLNKDEFLAYSNIEDLKAERSRLLARNEQIITNEKRILNTVENKASELNNTDLITEKKELEDKISNLQTEYQMVLKRKMDISDSIEELDSKLEDLSKTEEKIIEIDYLEAKYNLLIEKHKLTDNISNLYVTIATLTNNIESIREKYFLSTKIDDLHLTKARLMSEIEFLKSISNSENDKINAKKFGIYKNQYNFEKTDLYLEKIQAIRREQINISKDETLHVFSKSRIATDIVKIQKNVISLAVSYFNSDTIRQINSVKPSNLSDKEVTITKTFKKINRLIEPLNLQLSQDILDLKIQELGLAYEYSILKDIEKQELSDLRERKKEEDLNQKEYEKGILEKRAKLSKENDHFTKALGDHRDMLDTDISEEDRRAIEENISIIENRIQEVVEQDKQLDENVKVFNKAGYVYIVSNIGSYGEGVYKIGVTRREDPTLRVKDLSNASVPFPFDTHALIFSEDAFALETALHNEFNDKRINLANNKKEFFRVSLGEIKSVVRKNYNKVVEFIDEPDAEEYRQTLLLLEKELAA